jgi:hypothetical protein
MSKDKINNFCEFAAALAKLEPPFEVFDYESFEIEGDSMCPEVPSGTIIVGEKLKDIETFNDGWRYIIGATTDHTKNIGMIWFRRLYRTEDYSSTGMIKMVADADNSVTMLNKKDIIEMYKIYYMSKPKQ